MVSLVAAVAVACGRKGDPLPPIVRTPAAPESFIATRRADVVELTFVVPATNTDGSRPANIERVDVYALTGPNTMPDSELIERGTRIASLPVKSPRNPDDVVDDDEEVELVGTGLDHGVTARVREALNGLLARPGADDQTSSRQYVGLGISTRGRRGLLSQRAAVSLMPAPDPPPRPAVSYDQQQVTLTWERAPEVAYHVYEVVTAPTASENRLTQTPVSEPRFGDARIEWGAERCYIVRSVEERNGAVTESGSSPPGCVTMADRFAPAPPAGLAAVGLDGAVSLTWDANAESDLAGYVVLRGTSAETLAPLSPDPTSETTLRDTVPAGVRYFYAVQAVDRAGNRSTPSSLAEATAR